MLKKIVNGEEVVMSAEEEAQIMAEWGSFTPDVKTQPTKEELLARIQLLAEQVQALQ